MKPEFFRVLCSPLFALALLALATLPLWMPSYYLNIAILTLIYVALALAWNIVGGIAGQISLAHSLFVGAGAMVASALLVKFGLNMWLGALLAALISAALGACIAWLDFRFRLGHLSFALITMAFAEMGELIVLGWDFLGGASGIFLPKDTGQLAQFQFGGSSGSFWVMLILATVCLIVNLAVLNSPLGYFLRAIRDNEQAAQAIGVALLRNKMLAMVISAVLSSLIGTAYARYISFVDPYLLASPVLTIEIVLFATIGGLGTVFGPVIGAGLLVPLGEILRGQLGGTLPGLHYFIYGVVLIAVILGTPRGLAPLFGRWIRRLLATRPSSAGPIDFPPK